MTEARMEARVVAAGRGWQWLVEGYGLFRKSPAMWIALTIVLALMWVVSLIIPVLGPLLFNLMSPLLFAGLMIGCRALENGAAAGIRAPVRGLQAASRAAGDRRRRLPGRDHHRGGHRAGHRRRLDAALACCRSQVPTSRRCGRRRAAWRSPSPSAPRSTCRSSWLVWFAPLLVVFNGLAPVAAMKLSFTRAWRTCCHSWSTARRSCCCGSSLSLPGGAGRHRRAAGDRAARGLDPGADLLDLRELPGHLRREVVGQDPTPNKSRRSAVDGRPQAAMRSSFA